MVEKLSIEDRVLMLLENIVIEGHEILKQSTWEDMSIDSLTKIEFLMDLEDEFNISIPDEVMVYLETAAEVIEYIEKQLAKL